MGRVSVPAVAEYHVMEEPPDGELEVWGSPWDPHVEGKPRKRGHGPHVCTEGAEKHRLGWKDLMT